MIIHHADCLHKGIADGRANEPESSFGEVFAHGIRFGRFCRNFFQRSPRIDPGLTSHELPYESIEAAALLPNPEKSPGILDRSLYFQVVSDDALVLHQPLNSFAVVRGYLLRIKPVEGLPVIHSFLEDSTPA
jgi:hypothetical protein